MGQPLSVGRYAEWRKECKESQLTVPLSPVHSVSTVAAIVGFAPGAIGGKDQRLSSTKGRKSVLTPSEGEKKTSRARIFDFGVRM